MGIARELSERIVSTQYADLPPEVAYWGKVALRDTIGVAMAGASEPALKILHKTLEIGASSGPCLVLGTNQRVGALDAAFVNGTAAHALDFDNATNTMFGHASATMVPALLAAAEAHGATGENLLLAHGVGFETGARLGAAVNLHHYEKGWHPTSTLGIFGVAAACARLLNLSAAETEMALAMSTSFASGIKANFATMTKPLHAGLCARNGLLAVLLARNGFTAEPGAFEHKQGFLNVFNGPGNYDSDCILKDWAKPWDIVMPGACFKQYPCCASTHSAIDIARQFVKKHGRFDPESINKIIVRVSDIRLHHVNRPVPKTGLDAKFSLQYCVARALLDGNVLFHHFEADSHCDGRIQSMLKKVHAEPYDPSRFKRGEHVGAEVTILLVDGETLSAKLEQPLGRTSQNPIDQTELKIKFKDCVARSLSAESAESASKMIDDIDKSDSIQKLMKLLESPTSSLQESSSLRNAGQNLSQKS